jgi:hypothetical protein
MKSSSAINGVVNQSSSDKTANALLALFEILVKKHRFPPRKSRKSFFRDAIKISLPAVQAAQA